MRPVKRYDVNKRSSVGKFRHNVGRTKGANVIMLMRGGWRL